MKKVRLKIVFLLCMVVSAQLAQAQQKNSFVGIRFGKALPMGQFASHEFGKGGYALLGNVYGAEAAWFITKNLGLGADYSNKSFGFASGFYRDDYIENEPSYKSMDLLSGPYKLQSFMAGIYYKQTITGKFNSSFKLMAGMNTARTPDQLFGVIDNLFMRENFFWKTGSLDRTFGFLAGASFEYNIYEHISILLQADFNYAKHAFVFDNGQELYTSEMKMPVFQLLPGINIQF